MLTPAISVETGNSRVVVCRPQPPGAIWLWLSAKGHRRFGSVPWLRRSKLASNTHSLQPGRESGGSHAEQFGSPARAGDFTVGPLQSAHNALAFLTFPIVASGQFGAGGDGCLIPSVAVNPPA